MNTAALRPACSDLAHRLPTEFKRRLLDKDYDVVLGFLERRLDGDGRTHDDEQRIRTHHRTESDPISRGHRIGLREVSKPVRNMTDDFDKPVAVDGPVVNAGELGSSTFSPGQAMTAGPLRLGQRWTVARKREVISCGFCVTSRRQLLSHQLRVEIHPARTLA